MINLIQNLKYQQQEENITTVTEEKIQIPIEQKPIEGYVSEADSEPFVKTQIESRRPQVTKEEVTESDLSKVRDSILIKKE